MDMSDYKLLINGELVAGDATMTVINPATEEVLAECPRGSRDQLDAAVAAAKAAMAAWADTPVATRRKMLMALAGAIEADTDGLARLLTQEQGKPLAESMGEIQATISFIRTISALNLSSDLVRDDPDRRIEIVRRPLGVVAAILPWNFPVLLLTFKMPAALLTGNTMVIKPAPTTPLSTLRIAEMCQSIFPAGVINFVTDANDLGQILAQHPDVAKVSFTGSADTGRRVMASAASTLKRITLELGGNDAAIVLDDVDPKATAAGIYAGAFSNAGQVCIAVKRAYVHEAVYEDVCAELAALADAAVVDDGLRQGTQIGPLQNKMQYEKVKGFLKDAHENGTIIAGGSVPDRPGYFIRPTIVRDISDGCKTVDEEQFGPILPVIKFNDENDAIARANASPYALGGSIWSSDPERAWKLASQMNAGTVWINRHADLDPTIPFGGAKESGIGVELGLEGIKEFTQVQVRSLFA
jgi:acyl-CoA reductase-like NAD-dependent aldehyde dehydrogenase